MAKQRKRRVNLSGSPSEHLSEAREAITWVGKKLREAEGEMKVGTHGACTTALFALTNARRELGRAQGALVGYEGWTWDTSAIAQRKRLRRHLDRLDRVSFNAAKNFISHCVK